MRGKDPISEAGRPDHLGGMAGSTTVRSDLRTAKWVGVDEALFLRADARSAPVAGLSELGVAVSLYLPSFFHHPTECLMSPPL